MLLKFSKFFLYAAVFAVVIVMTTTFFPFIGGKDYFFRFTTELALIFFILWWAFEAHDGEVKSLVGGAFRKPLFVAVSIFVLVFLLASIFAYDPHAAFWSNFERGEGGFQMLHYYVFFTLLVLLFKREEDWKTMFKASIAAAILLILYGICANLGVSGFISPYSGAATVPSTVWGKLTLTRFQGSLGNPAYVAPYLLFSIFFAFYLYFSDIQSGRKWSRGAPIYFPLLAAFTFFFYFSKTRGTFVGLVVAAAVFFIILALCLRSLRKFAIGFLAAMIVAGSVVYYYKDSDFVQNLPGGRIFQVSFSESTGQTRIWTWGSAWKGFLERPVLGWGPENFSTVFDKYFDPRHFVPGEQTETWFDRAHSLFFDYLAETGILGLLGYLSIYAVFWNASRKKIMKAAGYPAGGNQPGSGHRAAQPEKRPGTMEAVKQALIFSVPVAYLVQGVVIFEVLPVYVNFFLFMAFACYEFYK